MKDKRIQEGRRGACNERVMHRQTGWTLPLCRLEGVLRSLGTLDGFSVYDTMQTKRLKMPWIARTARRRTGQQVFLA